MKKPGKLMRNKIMPKKVLVTNKTSRFSLILLPKQRNVPSLTPQPPSEIGIDAINSEILKKKRNFDQLIKFQIM